MFWKAYDNRFKVSVFQLSKPNFSFIPSGGAIIFGFSIVILLGNMLVGEHLGRKLAPIASKWTRASSAAVTKT